jgi:hypothetical protein
VTAIDAPCRWKLRHGGYVGQILIGVDWMKAWDVRQVVYFYVSGAAERYRLPAGLRP